MDTGFEALRDHIASMGKVVVCFSGGLDSTALMDICKRALGDDAIAFYLSTPMESELTASMVDRISGHLGFDVIRRVMDDRLSGIVLQNRTDTIAHSAASAATRTSIQAPSVGTATVNRVGSTPISREIP
ncbi:MAG: hypothetical protein J6R75_00105 [Candidatus Methanomethylophilaceae archaeon]|nr:hypothetical protein [Candidatus Methanomethylophilaceae archaeon]